MGKEKTKKRKGKPHTVFRDGSWFIIEFGVIRFLFEFLKGKENVSKKGKRMAGKPREENGKTDLFVRGIYRQGATAVLSFRVT